MAAAAAPSSKKVYRTGWIEIRSSQDKDFRKYFAKLTGRELWLFSEAENTRETQIEDKISLCNVDDVTIRPESRILGRVLSPPLIALNFKNKEIKIKTEDFAELGLWYRYVHTVALFQPWDIPDVASLVQLKAPPDEKDLLPGQQQELLDIVTAVVGLPTYEQACAPLSPPPYSETLPGRANNINDAVDQVLVSNPKNSQPTYTAMMPCDPHKSMLPHFFSASSVENQLNDQIRNKSQELQPPAIPQKPRPSFDEKLPRLPDRNLPQQAPSCGESFQKPTCSSLHKQTSKFALNLPQNVNYVPERPPKPNGISKAPVFEKSKCNLIIDKKPLCTKDKDAPLRNRTGPEHQTKNIFADSDQNRRKSLPLPELPPNQHQTIGSPYQSHRLSESGAVLYPRVQLDNYSWFIERPFSRSQAENFLDENNKSGNMILRVRQRSSKEDVWSYAVSIRLDGSSIEYKHYLVRKELGDNANYIINLNAELHPPIYTLEGVMAYFQTKSGGKFKPINKLFSLEENVYDDRIPGHDEENQNHSVSDNANDNLD